MLRLFKKPDEAPPTTETIDSQLSRAREVQGEHFRLFDATVRLRHEREALQAAREAANSPIWRADHDLSDLARIDSDCDTALRAEGKALQTLSEFERQHGTAKDIVERLADVQRQKDEEEKAAIRDKYRAMAADLLPHLEAARQINVEMDQLHFDATKRWGTQACPINRCGLNPEFYFDFQFPRSNHARTQWGEAIVSLAVQFPDLLAPDHPLIRDVKITRESFGWKD